MNMHGIFRVKKLLLVMIHRKCRLGNIDISILNPSKEDLNTLADVWMKDISRQCKKVIVCNNHLFDLSF